MLYFIWNMAVWQRLSQVKTSSGTSVIPPGLTPSPPPLPHRCPFLYWLAFRVKDFLKKEFKAVHSQGEWRYIHKHTGVAGGGAGYEHSKEEERSPWEGPKSGPKTTAKCWSWSCMVVVGWTCMSKVLLTDHVHVTGTARVCWISKAALLYSAQLLDLTTQHWATLKQEEQQR